jgi:peptidyl-prolyl cis-trans isomerase SurA
MNSGCRRWFLRTSCLCLVLYPVAAEATRQPVDHIVAVIDNEIITAAELDAKAAPYLAQAPKAHTPAQAAAQRARVLRQVLDVEIGERMVNREIAESKDRLGVGDKDVDRAIDDVMATNHLDREQLQAALYGQGLTWGEYRQKLRNQIERARLIQFKVQGKVQLKDAEVLRRCEERGRAEQGEVAVCASHVLLAIPPAASSAEVAKLQERANTLQAELAAGADFSAYAAAYSADRAAADGQLGCFRRGEMVEAFESAAFALPVGGVSSVVRTEFGLHIIKVTDRRAAAAPACDSPAALEPFRSELYQEEMQRQMEAWVQEWRARALVDIRL